MIGAINWIPVTIGIDQATHWPQWISRNPLSKVHMVVIVNMKRFIEIEKRCKNPQPQQDQDVSRKFIRRGHTRWAKNYSVSAMGCSLISLAFW